jgi:hypothetical protein
MSILQKVMEQYRDSETPKAPTDKTDKRASVGSVSEWSEHFETQPTDWEPHEIPVAIEVEQIRLARLKGEIPDCYTATTTCKHCGPVPIFEGFGPEVLGCPWCFNRRKGLPIPKPATHTEADGG